MAATPAFLPVEIIDHVRKDDPVVTSEPTHTQELIEVELAGGHRMRITGSYDPDALARGQSKNSDPQSKVIDL